MKYGMFILIAVLSLLLAGCSDKGGTEVVIPTGNVVSEPSTQQTAQQTTTQSTPILSSSEISLAEDKLKKGENVAVSTPYKIMSVGDVYVFAVGVKNIYPKEYNFRIRPTIEDAKSTGLANIIHTDNTIENWLARNRFTVFSLDMREQKILPLIIEVGPKVAASQETIPGSYTFDIVFEYEKTSRFWERYNTGQDLLVIKVKE